MERLQLMSQVHHLLERVGIICVYVNQGTLADGEVYMGSSQTTALDAPPIAMIV